MNEFKQNEVLNIKTNFLLQLLKDYGNDDLFVNSQIYNSPYKYYFVCHLYNTIYNFSGIPDIKKFTAKDSAIEMIRKKPIISNITYKNESLIVTINNSIYVYTVNKYLQIVLNNEVLPFQIPILSDKIINESKKRLLKK